MLIPALLLGALVGLVLGLVGAGGSIIAIPALVLGLGLSLEAAIPASLVVVGISSVIAAVPRARTGVDWRVAGLVGLAGIPAAWAGTALGRIIDQHFLLLSFSAVMVLAGVRMLADKSSRPGPCAGATRSWRSCAPRAVAVGILVGTLTGLFGVGGGFLILPALTLLLGIPLRRAVGTSLVIIVLNSAAGLSAHAVGFEFDWSVLGIFAASAIVASLAAALLAGRLPDRLIRTGFAVLVFLTAVVVATSAIFALVSSGR
ncbi:MAG: sulfite exporter TauE/SafE family protein [Terrimesophilobacter sp.]